MFYFIAVVMVVVAIGFVVVPLMRAHRRLASDDAVSVDAANLDVFRQQKRELDAECKQGLMNDAEHEAALNELASRLRGDLASVTVPPLAVETPATKVKEGSALPAINAPKMPWMLVSFISVFIVVGAAGGYKLWGGYSAEQSAAQMAANLTAGNSPDVTGAPGAPGTEGQLPDKKILDMVEALAKKMADNPNDPKGWVLLARSQNALGQFDLAVKAFERASALLPNDSQLLADYADAQAMVQQGNMAGKPAELIKKALKLDPNNMKALALAGTAAMRAGDKPQALKHWEKLKSLVPKDSEDLAQVNAIITEIQTGKPAFPVSAPTTPLPTTPTATASSATPAAVGKTVLGQVDIAPELKSRLAAGDTLFVFARAVNGPKMPLAVLRLPVPKAWPFAFELNDAMAMAPNMNLSSFPEVTIEARISKAGSAQLQPGDLGGVSAAIKPPAKGVAVMITKVAP